MRYLLADTVNPSFPAVDLVDSSKVRDEALTVKGCSANAGKGVICVFFFRVILCLFFLRYLCLFLAVFASSLKEWRLFCPFSTLSVSFFSALSVSFFLRYLYPFFFLLWVSSESLYVRRCWVRPSFNPKRRCWFRRTLNPKRKCKIGKTLSPKRRCWLPNPKP